MKTVFLSCIIIIVIQFKLSSQESQLPIEVEISLINEYEEVLNKEALKWAYPYSYDNIQGDSAVQKKYDIEILIKNLSNEPVFIWLMSCSWTVNFIINNDYIRFEGWGCDKNIPQQNRIKPLGIVPLSATLIKDIKFDYPGNSVYGYGVETTRVGLIVLNDISIDEFDHFEYNISMEDKSKWKIIWSNPLHLHKFDGGFLISNDEK